MVKKHLSRRYGQSTIQLLKDLRLNYAVVSSGLILLGFFWNKLEGFDWQYVALIVSIFYANLFGYVINDFYDATYDYQEYCKKLRNLFCSSNTKRLGKVVLYASLSLSLLFGGIVSPQIFIIIVLFNILAFCYSAPPFNLRNRLYWDWIFIFLWKGLIIFTGYFYFSGLILPSDLFIWGTLMMVLLLSLISQIDNQIRDFKTDKITNIDNTVQRLGTHNASSINRFLIGLFYTFSFVFCFLLGHYVTMLLILLNVCPYFFVNSSKYGKIIQFTNIWIVVLFLEHFMGYFSYQQQLLAYFWIVVMGGIAFRHVKRTDLFNGKRS